jgi:hypothetical protein
VIGQRQSNEILVVYLARLALTGFFMRRRLRAWPVCRGTFCSAGEPQMSGILEETLLSLPDACSAFPGRKVSRATLHRWRLSGVRGVVLETVMIGGRRLTSLEAIKRFLDAQNEQPVDSLTATDRAVRSAVARASLKARGV